VAQAIAITGGRVVPVEGDPIDGGTVVLQDGTIAAEGKTVHAALDAAGKPCRLPARVREVFA